MGQWAWSDDYIGWAPVPPTFGITTSGYSGPAVAVAPARYVFVPANQFVGVNVQTLRIPPSRNAILLPRARKATGFAVSGGVVRATANPPLSFVQRVSGKRIERVSLDKVKARPTTLADARVSSKRIRVVAPSRDRATVTVAKHAETSGKSREKSTARQISPGSRSPSASERHAARQGPPLQTLSPPVSEPVAPKHERAHDAHQPKHARERSESGPPPDEPPGQVAPGSGPPLQVRENPHPPPPPPPQAGKPSAAEGKEKEKGRN